MSATLIGFLCSMLPVPADVNDASAAKEKIVIAFEEKQPNATDSFMICIFDVMRDPDYFQDSDQLRVTGTVVDVFKGNRAIGDKFDYPLRVGGESKRKAPDEGSLLLIQIVPDPSRATGKVTLIFPFRPVVYEAARRSSQDAEQGGAGEPATRPESDSTDGDNPQPESEGRSR